MKTNIFTTFIYSEKLDIDNTEIIKDCYNSIETNSYEKNKSKLNLEYKSLNNLYNIISHKVNEVWKEYDTDKILECDRAWINLNRTESVVASHIHTYGFLSAVYYPLADKDCDKLCFSNPAREIQYVMNRTKVNKYSEYNSTIWQIQPYSGLLVIFPSWIYHSTSYTPEQKTDRISIAFDYE